MSDASCTSCRGRGITSGRHWLGLALAELLGAGAATYDQKPHYNWFEETLADECGVYPTNDLGELTTALAGREPEPRIGYDTYDRYNAVDKIIKAAGFDPKVWGICPDCKGESM